MEMGREEGRDGKERMKGWGKEERRRGEKKGREEGERRGEKKGREEGERRRGEEEGGEERRRWEGVGESGRTSRHCGDVTILDTLIEAHAD
ncbi:hypothetical protein Pmani_034881 [Petrolisthes manimaculis]|uniref:Uncharacterized protein n=1 Tax=Petrolisthes manimaculis TaxID=1843537 RepID=A0AAE1TNX6_9EUCA|nr:hypothetical protein Pmani_034881 [Petrolisthes manimaculis]